MHFIGGWIKPAGESAYQAVMLTAGRLPALSSISKRAGMHAHQPLLHGAVSHSDKHNVGLFDVAARQRTDVEAQCYASAYTYQSARCRLPDAGCRMPEMNSCDVHPVPIDHAVERHNIASDNREPSIASSAGA